MVIAIVIIGMTLGAFNLLTGKELSLLTLLKPQILFAIVFFTITIGLIAGSYPAFYLTGF